MERVQVLAQPIYLRVFVEDELGRALIDRILREYGNKFAWDISVVNGFGNIKKRIKQYNAAARRCPMLILIDLDKTSCACLIIQEWLPEGAHHNLLFRIAVREVESWVMADRETLAIYLSVAETIIPAAPEMVDDPKKCIIEIARRSKKRNIREALLPKPNSMASVGREYNSVLTQYVYNNWRPEVARINCESLDRTMRRLEQFQPQY
ncbi:DUF4276 family protein [Sporolituus thermophilus]|uniref:DUF4276 family protein n=1 Tax=Sporolituus thermophilus DSM 23256 TaxID=1123285 RepID=A0A1G7JSH4_9FIRM|nr:DUF4276 family protein [Sporolituus thermophilus]SDF27821.1 protein of unknown function [Sporolituus thermophilus DSM 23256]